MAVSTVIGAETGEIGAPLLDVVNGVVDYEGRPVSRSKSGGWRSAFFVIGVEVTERFAYYGIESNLISYLTRELGQPTAAAAANVNAWSGTASLLPLLGAFIADSFIGRFRTIIIASLLYILGLGLLTISAVLYPLHPFDSQSSGKTKARSSSNLETIFFFFALYLVALAQGGHKPCVQAFGADQFDSQDPKECVAKSSFFNWWYFGLCIGATITILISSYIQDNLSWALGFGIPCAAMLIAMVIFLLGSMTYRFSIKGNEKSPFRRIVRVFVNAAKNWQATPSAMGIEEGTQRTLPEHGAQQFKFLNKALLAPIGSHGDRDVCSLNEVEEAKEVLRLAPIWATCLAFGIVFAQSSTLFTKQGVTMERSIGSNFQLPAAALQCFIGLSIVLFIPIYDRVFVPTARAMTQNPSGITMLQRIGTGMFISAISMAIAALIERRRLETAWECGLVDKPEATVPMSIWWLVPQYVLLGLAEVFTVVGMQEFFYDQVPNELKSVGLALYLSIIGIGSFLSSFLISVIEKATRADGEDGWFSNKLNRAHLDYFYWLLAGLSAAGLIAFLYFAKSYMYKRGSAV